MSSWWLQMSWRQIGARPSATTMLTLQWLKYIIVAHASYYAIYIHCITAIKPTMCERVWEVHNPLVSLLLDGSSFHSDNAPSPTWCLVVVLTIDGLYVSTHKNVSFMMLVSTNANKPTHYGLVTTIWQHTCWPALVQVTACHMFSAKPLTWTNAGLLLIGPLETNFSEIRIKRQVFSLKYIYIFKNDVCKMAAILTGPQCGIDAILWKRKQINASINVAWCAICMVLISGQANQWFKLTLKQLLFFI